jgi:hypothetical protein
MSHGTVPNRIVVPVPFLQQTESQSLPPFAHSPVMAVAPSFFSAPRPPASPRSTPSRARRPRPAASPTRVPLSFDGFPAKIVLRRLRRPSPAPLPHAEPPTTFTGAPRLPERSRAAASAAKRLAVAVLAWWSSRAPRPQNGFVVLPSPWPRRRA